MLIYGNMKRIFGSRPAKMLLIVVVLLLAGFGIYHQTKKPAIASEHPEYLSFSGNYVFPILKHTKVDEESVPGLQLIYGGQVSAKTLDDIYNIGGISLQPIDDLSDSSSKAFKDYVNYKFHPEIKARLSTEDVRITFDKINGWDVARTVVIKDGNQTRFIYLKNGRHPVAVVAKAETDSVKKLETILTDVEESDLKKEVEPIKQTLKTTVQLINDKKTHELYRASAPELQALNTEKEFTESFSTAVPFIKSEATVYGVSYSPGEFSAVLIFSSSSAKDAPRAYSTLNFKMADGQWKLKGLTLPTVAVPAQKL